MEDKFLVFWIMADWCYVLSYRSFIINPLPLSGSTVTVLPGYISLKLQVFWLFLIEFDLIYHLNAKLVFAISKQGTKFCFVENVKIVKWIRDFSSNHPLYCVCVGDFWKNWIIKENFNMNNLQCPQRKYQNFGQCIYDWRRNVSSSSNKCEKQGKIDLVLDLH